MASSPSGDKGSINKRKEELTVEGQSHNGGIILCGVTGVILMRIYMFFREYTTPFIQKYHRYFKYERA
jgi:hypothetical protein